MAQTLYLTEEEAEIYCDQLPVTMSQVAFASALIDAFCGRHDGSSLFSVSQATEVVRLNRRGIGRLRNKPVISIDKIYQIANGLMGQSEIELNPSQINYDEEGYIFTGTTNTQITRFNLMPSKISQIKVTYTYGYAEIPEQVKRACAMLAMNISQTATFTNLESMTTLDARFSLADPSLFTTDIKSLLTRYRK